MVTIVWTYNGLPPSEMEGRIVTICERALTTTVNDIEHSESESYQGVSVIRVYFQPTVKVELAVSQIQGGIQLTLPIRNRIAASDAARDTIQLRQSQARSEKLGDLAREEIETSLIALETAFSAYKAATASRFYQEQLFEAERDKLQAGQSTDLLVVQNQAFLAQARSTEIAARSNWMKARIDLDRATGDLLQKNSIDLDDVVNGSIAQH